jgi:hypothetical protein
MFQRICHRRESALEKAALAIRRDGCPAGVRIARVAKRFLPACKALAKAHIMLGMLGASRPPDPLLAPLQAASRLAPAADAGLASTNGPSRGCGWPAWADTGNAAACTV